MDTAKKIVITYGKPYFLPRAWLEKTENGGKTAREIIDFIMLSIAKRFGQTKMVKNKLLQRRRKEEAKPWWS